MKHLLVNLNLSDLGGANKVAVTIADELSKLGEDINLVTLYRPNLQKIYHQWKIDLSKIKISYFRIPFGLGKSMIFSYSIFYPFIVKMFNKYKPDQVIFNDDVIDPLNKINVRIIQYNHFSLSLFIQYFPGGISGIKRKIYEKLLKNSKKADIIIANSSETARRIRKAWKREDVKIIFPPVDTFQFKPHEKKKNIVVVLARFLPYKNFEDAIKACNLSETKPKLYLIGFENSRSYLKRLIKLAKEYRYKEIFFFTNVPSEKVSELLSKAKIVVHPCKVEPFGIAIVEAMSAGCVPIVYKSPWGPWYDIVDKGNYGLGYETIDELAAKIDEVIIDEKKFKFLSRIAMERAKKFDTEIFRKNIRKFLLKFLL
jgi:glycosyltransferase involved in cell wall biosynthesis